MKKLIFITFLFCSANLMNAQEWINTELNHKFSISFPISPEIINLGNKTVFQLEESEYIVNAVLTDLSNNPNFQIQIDKLDEFYKGVIKGVLDAATDSVLISEEIIKVEELEGREIVYTKNFNGIDNIKVTKRIFIIDKVVLVFDFWELTSKDYKLLINKFFNSFKVL